MSKWKKAAAAVAVAAASCGGTVERSEPTTETLADEPWSVLTAIMDGQERHFARTGEICLGALQVPSVPLESGEEYRAQDFDEWGNWTWHCPDGFVAPRVIHYSYGFGTGPAYVEDFQDLKMGVEYPPFETVGTRQVLQVYGTVLHPDATAEVHSLWAVVTDGGGFTRR